MTTLGLINLRSDKPSLGLIFVRINLRSDKPSVGLSGTVSNPGPTLITEPESAAMQLYRGSSQYSQGGVFRGEGQRGHYPPPDVEK